MKKINVNAISLSIASLIVVILLFILGIALVGQSTTCENIIWPVMVAAGIINAIFGVVAS